MTKQLAVANERGESMKRAHEKLEQELVVTKGELAQHTKESERLLQLLMDRESELQTTAQRAKHFERQLKDNSTPDKFQLTQLQDAMRTASEKLQQQVRKTQESEAKLKREGQAMAKLKSD